MIRLLFTWAAVFFICGTHAQTVAASLKKELAQLQSDPQMQHAAFSLHVADATTGAVVFAHNSNLGLTPASTQKVLTSVTAYALLGKDFRYTTQFSIQKRGTQNHLFITPSGDPTLGSWRWAATKEEGVLQRIKAALLAAGVKSLATIQVQQNGHEEAIPGGWTWEDMGNYYGAGAHSLNWRENQYDLLLRSGNKVGDEATIINTVPKLYDFAVNSRVRAAEKGTGDRTIIYLPLMSRQGVIRGTIPAGEPQFKVSGSFPNPMHQFVQTLRGALAPQITLPADDPAIVDDTVRESVVLHTEASPPVDSIVYWLNQKSVNLYAEALLKTMAQKAGREGATDAGLEVVKSFWKGQGIKEAELNIKDGSGLSPQNYVTTKAQVAVLLYAKKQPWFNSFYASLPLYNGMKMKSGTIGSVKGFCGYHTSKSGAAYAFSFLINNYNGTSSAMVQKMYAVLNVLK